MDSDDDGCGGGDDGGSDDGDHGGSNCDVSGMIKLFLVTKRRKSSINCFLPLFFNVFPFFWILLAHCCLIICVVNGFPSVFFSPPLLSFLGPTHHDISLKRLPQLANRSLCLLTFFLPTLSTKFVLHLATRMIIQEYKSYSVTWWPKSLHLQKQKQQQKPPKANCLAYPTKPFMMWPTSFYNLILCHSGLDC